jgi:hypothetical protein
VLASIVWEHVYRRINTSIKKSDIGDILASHRGRWNTMTRLLCVLSSLIEFRLAFRAVRSIYWRRMYKINLFSRFFFYLPTLLCGYICTRPLRKSIRPYTWEREREKGMWRSLVAKVKCWSPGRHPLCRIFLFSQYIVQYYYNRYGQVNKCVYALNNMKNRI